MPSVVVMSIQPCYLGLLVVLSLQACFLPTCPYLVGLEAHLFFTNYGLNLHPYMLARVTSGAYRAIRCYNCVLLL